MYSNSEGRKSVDSLSSPGVTHKADFPFHRQPSSNTYVRQRRESIASSIHSIGGSLDTAIGGGWNDPVLELSQNAISTLLQPPIVRTGLLPHTSAPAHSTHKPPTAKDIPPVTLTNITHVETSEFAAYLSQVGALHDQLRRVKESDEEQAAIIGGPRRNGSKDDLGDALNDGFLRPGGKRQRKSSISSISSFTLTEAPSPARRSSSSARRGNQGPPPLSTIPNVYFDDDFHLENPRTFDIVSERSEVVPSAAPASADEKVAAVAPSAAKPPRKALATNAILQEKLSWYMDTVEMHLISSISTASTAFFTALGSLKELHTEAAESVDSIKAMRTELAGLDDEIAIRGLDIVQKQRRQRNIQQFHEAVMQLKDIVDSVAACEALVDENEVDKALDSIDDLEKLIAGEEPPVKNGTTSQEPETKTKTKATPARRPRQYALRDLRGATALQGVNDDISTLRLRIGKAYEARFVSVLMSDIRRHTESVSRQEVLMRWSSASARARGSHGREASAFPAYLASTDDLRAELLPILTGLYRAKHITAATQVFRDQVLREIRNLVRRPLPSSNDDDNESLMSTSTMGGGRHLTQQEKSSILARNLRALDAEDAEELLIKVYISITETLRRLTTQVKVLLDVASSVGEDESSVAAALLSPMSPSGRQPQPPLSSAGMEAQGELHRTLDMNNLLGQAVDVAQDKVVKLLRVRTEQSSHLSRDWFLRYFTLNLHFANECEGISGRSGTTLKTVVNGQIKEFVQHHGNTEMQKLAQDMEQDQWTARDFAERDAELLQQIVDASTKDAEAWTESVKVWTPCAEVDSDNEDDGTSNNEAAAAAAAAGKAKTRSAVIDAESYLLPHSAMLCLEGMSHFLHLSVAIPFMAADVASSLVQYLQLFNSRCTQLILGAGATRSAGLKNITTRHLAIASQALAFLAALVPYVREAMRRRLGSGYASGATSSLMGEFDRVRRLYQEHQNSIYDKLVEIMSGRAQTHARAMRGINWEADAGGAESAAAPHPYMETLAKETTTLHRNLTKTLPAGTVRFIMGSVFSGYKETLGGVFRAADVKTATGRNSMLRDVATFQTRLSKIDGFEDAGDYLKGIVEAKEIKILPSPEEKTSDTTEVEDKDDTKAAAKESDDQAEGKPSKEENDTNPPPPPPKDDKAVPKTKTQASADAPQEVTQDKTEKKDDEKTNGPSTNGSDEKP